MLGFSSVVWAVKDCLKLCKGVYGTLSAKCGAEISNGSLELCKVTKMKSFIGYGAK